jgi:hypothetical protein
VIGLFPIIKGSGTPDSSEIELSLGVFSPFLKYMVYSDINKNSSVAVDFQFNSWSLLIVVIGIVFFIYRIKIEYYLKL